MCSSVCADIVLVVVADRSSGCCGVGGGYVCVVVIMVVAVSVRVAGSCGSLRGTVSVSSGLVKSVD